MKTNEEKRKKKIPINENNIISIKKKRNNF